MKQLSKREKALLYALAVIAVLVGIYMLIIVPAQERSEALDAQIQADQLQADSMQALIGTVADMEQQIETYEQDIEAEAEFYLPAMTSDDLDKYITGLLQGHGLVAQSLAISADDAQSESDMIRIYRVDVLARGRVSQFMELADTVEATDGLRLAKLTFQKAVTPAPTATPKPQKTPKPKRRVRATPTPEPTLEPTPTPYDPAYMMEMTFVVMEYDENASVVNPAPEPETTAAAQDESASDTLENALG